LDGFDPGLAPRVALWESIVAVMRRAIVLGELQAGLHLEEPALAEKFGVSRIPIREALTRLSHEGLVRLERRRGAFVVSVTPDDIHDIYDFRMLIETHAVRRAAERADAAGIARLRSHADQMAEAIRFDSAEKIAGPDVLFHHEIVAISGSKRLLAAWDPIGGLVATFLSITNTTYRDLPSSLGSHYRLIELIRSGDRETAALELRRHLESGEQIMHSVLHPDGGVTVAENGQSTKPAAPLPISRLGG
jgi:GntR family transcriptional regulator of gluconate operon